MVGCSRPDSCAVSTSSTCPCPPEWGPECVDSPHFRRPNIDCLETVQLLEESGFGFLSEADLQNQPSMETDVGWPQIVCPGVYFEATEGVSTPECFRIAAG